MADTNSDTDYPGTFVVTGAGGGIGGAAAESLLRAGANVVGVDISNRRLSGFAERVTELPGTLHTIRADITVEAGAQAVIDETMERFEDLQGIANVAGGMPNIDAASYDMLLQAIEPEWFTATFRLNVDSAFLVSRAAEPHLAERGYGKIVNVASLAAIGNRTELGNAAYNSAKAAVIGLTRTLSVLHGPLGIRVNAILPGLIISPRVDSFTPQDYRQRHLDNVPLGRLATLQEAGDTIKWLLSPESDGITGEFIRVAAGLR